MTGKNGKFYYLGIVLEFIILAVIVFLVISFIQLVLL